MTQLELERLEAPTDAPKMVHLVDGRRLPEMWSLCGLGLRQWVDPDDPIDCVVCAEVFKERYGAEPF